MEEAIWSLESRLESTLSRDRLLMLHVFGVAHPRVDAVLSIGSPNEAMASNLCPSGFIHGMGGLSL